MAVELELSVPGPDRPGLFGDLVVAADELAAVAQRWRAQVPEGVPVGGPAPRPLPAPLDVADTLVGGTSVHLDLPAWVGDGLRASSGNAQPRDEEVVALADILIEAVHAGVGFGTGLLPRCTDTEQVWAVLSAAVEAITGGDVRSALRQPDRERVLGLGQAAGEAVRDVVTFCVVDPASAADVRDALERDGAGT